jgi:integrase
MWRTLHEGSVDIVQAEGHVFALVPSDQAKGGKTVIGRAAALDKLRRFFDPAAERVGLQGLRVHDLRHTAVALLIDQNVQPAQIAARLGHENVRTTLGVNGHLFDAHDDQPPRRWMPRSVRSLGGVRRRSCRWPASDRLADLRLCSGR